MRIVIFIPDTEYGGIIDDIQSDGYELTFGGLTWRGLLTQKNCRATDWERPPCAEWRIK